MTVTRPMNVAALIKELKILPQGAPVFRYVPGRTEGHLQPFTMINIQFDGPNVIIF